MFDNTVDEVSPATARAWITKWCDVEPGDSREVVRQKMGKPTGEFTDQDEWSGPFGLSFTVFYDSDFNARQVQTDTQQWSPADRARLKCADTRDVEGSDFGD